MRVLATALLSIALMLQATLVLATPVGLLQHRHTPRKAPIHRLLAPRASATARPLPTLELRAGSTLVGRNIDDAGKKKKKGGVQVTGAVVVINNPNDPNARSKPKEDCEDKSFFKKLWCKVTT